MFYVYIYIYILKLYSISHVVISGYGTYTFSSGSTEFTRKRKSQ